MKYFILTIGIFSLWSCSSSPQNEMTAPSTAVNRTTTSSSFEELIQLFDALNQGEVYNLDNSLFERVEESQAGKMIPFDLDNEYLEGKHKTDETQNQPFGDVQYALKQIKVGQNIGLITTKKAVGVDGRHQDYLLYLFTPTGKRVTKQAIAFSRAWQGGFEEQTTQLSYTDGNWIIEGQVKKKIDDWLDTGDANSLYEQYQAKVTYTITSEESIQKEEKVYFNAQPDPYSSKIELKSDFDFDLLSPTSERFDNWKNEGGIENAIAWEDKNGYNAVFWVKKTRNDFPVLQFAGEDAEVVLRAYHYTSQSNQSKLLWEMKDYEALCDLDLTTNFLYPSVNLTDLDKDGVAEVSFMYTLGCTGDVSPAILKLMLYENGEKYALRGRTRLPKQMEFATDSEYKVDKAFNKAPKAFLKFAKEQWVKYDKIY